MAWETSSKITSILFLLLICCLFPLSSAFAETGNYAPAAEPDLAEPQGEVNIDEEYVYGLTLDLMGRDSSEMGITIFPDGWFEQTCLKAGNKACRIYCSIQTDHSFNTCMNGFLWIDGCLDKVEDFCEQHFSN